MSETSAIMDRAARLLENWSSAADAYWLRDENDASMGCYGPGYLTWGVQSNWNYAGAMATLACCSSGAKATQAADRALAALRFELATHVAGSRSGNDGRKWGRSWISMLGIERAMHGISRIENSLPEEDRDSLHRVLVSEADWILNEGCRGSSAGVAAGKWNTSCRNNPESNVWSGALLWRVAARYPGESRADQWRELAHRYLLNGVSIDADAEDQRVIEGLPVRERHVGANFFPNYALDHHGYLNIGYMVICASNAAILHFDLKLAGLAPPESLYHHHDDMWRVLRRFVFSDGRLARIGGDSRVRYAYCQEYLLPTLLLAADRFGDAHALELAERQILLMEADADAAGDGSFYGRRLDRLRMTNPHYYTRLESDRACVLAMLLNYLPAVKAPPASPQSFENSVAGGWAEPEHGAVMQRSPSRLCSFAWRARGLAQGLCVPSGAGNMAEWELNMSPVVRFLGDDGSQPGRHRRLVACDVAQFDGGFVTCGSVMEGCNITVDEGASCTDQALTWIAFAALPDERTCVCIQYVVAASDRVVYLVELKDLHLVIPNDIFNGSNRRIMSAAGSALLAAPPGQDESLAFEGRWLNIDDSLGVVLLSGGESLLINRSAARRAGTYRSLYTEEVCVHVRAGAERCMPGEILTDIGFAVLSGETARGTASVHGGPISFRRRDVRGLWVDGTNGRRYALAANFSGSDHAVDLFGETIHLPAGKAIVRSVSGAVCR